MCYLRMGIVRECRRGQTEKRRRLFQSLDYSIVTEGLDSVSHVPILVPKLPEPQFLQLLKVRRVVPWGEGGSKGKGSGEAGIGARTQARKTVHECLPFS